MTRAPLTRTRGETPISVVVYTRGSDPPAHHPLRIAPAHHPLRIASVPRIARALAPDNIGCAPTSRIYLFDLETESAVLCAGEGITWMRGWSAETREALLAAHALAGRS